MSDLIAPVSVVEPTTAEALMADAATAIAAGQVARVFELLEQEGDRLDAWRRVSWGHQLLATGATAEAIALFRRITEQSPTAPEGWVALGNCLSQQGDRAEAQACFQQAHALRGWPESADRGYEFSQDWFSDQLPHWERHLAPLQGQPVQGFEIGSFEGMSACWLLDRVLTHPAAQLTCIDPDPQAAFHSNLAKTGQADRVRVIQALSWEALEPLPPNTYDLAYIDGCHTPWVAFRDAVQTWPTLRTGGLVIIDDYRYQGEPDDCPKPGVDLFLALFSGCFELLNNDYQLFLRKTRDWDPATAPLDRVLLLTDDSLLLDGLGWFLLRMRQWDLAQRVCERAIALYPMSTYSYITLGQVWSQRGPLPEALPRRYSPLTRHLIRYFADAQPSQVAFADRLDLNIMAVYWQTIACQAYWYEPIINLVGLLDYQIQHQELAGAIAAWTAWAASEQWGQTLALPTSPHIYQQVAKAAASEGYQQILPLIDEIQAIAQNAPNPHA